MSNNIKLRKNNAQQNCFTWKSMIFFSERIIFHKQEIIISQN